MVELITIVEGFYACGVAASVYAAARRALRGDDARRRVRQRGQAAAGHEDLRHAPPRALRVSGGLIVTLPGPDEDHNPETGGRA
jgi:4-hydroxybutyryl-CoA dehydratase/vinylacetyl-CoA-Delta-isomerase